MAAWVALLVALLAVAIGAALALLRVLRHALALEPGTIGFFHPFADGGGGGERVLWVAIQALQVAYPSVKLFIYVREGVSAAQLQQHAADHFNIVLPQPFEVVPLKRTHLVRPERYRRFTMIRQAAGSALLGWEALSLRVPQVFVDTTGWAFTFPLAKLAGCKVACYVHYPTVSTDMLGRVLSRQATITNDEAIANNSLRSMVKVAYYQAFALVYGFCGAFADVVMVNSSWTRDHIQSLWWSRQRPARVYPPCDTEELQRLPLDRRLKHLYLVSVAQFRPEKNQRLQLEAYAMARQQAGPDDAGRAVRVSKLKMVGSVRGKDDQRLLEELQDYARELGIESSVEWCVNVPFTELRALLGGAVGGLHSMTDEHFGISVVEYMAAGVIPIAHNSGGPRADIVVPLEGRDGPQITGYLAETPEEYCDAITRVLVMPQVERLRIAAAAQRHAAKFSGENFTAGFLDAMAPVAEAAAAAAAPGATTAERAPTTVPTPVVRIDNIHDPFATVVTVEFGDRLGELLDTVTALKNLGLNITRAKLAGAAGRTANTFFVTNAQTSDKITRIAQIEDIRMTIIKNLLYYHPESSEALAMGRAASAAANDAAAPMSPRNMVPTTIEVTEAPNGSCSICYIETPDRPGLLVDIVRTLKDINVNVASAEIDTIGAMAKDELFITYEGEPLDGPMVQLVTDALKYHLASGELAK
ncbi:alpha-1,2-mannosyltransferase [Monoraphidium neglectum]|uniref:GDP-Man:Man(3)GlcNAc(2)-PP-Dol alpha-1,2-mannosyltransferase n=1 Tax=Monoraphidium neglectum TaxID=145388 RepID=A0A0D2MVN6_9CHLO|nr:alpha-1,2-mannosyltransferase [Monoraphidium neglectum]KIZ06575.1 alpha-1,2-mannosyltransferase [Monoraphidium neglectum]|eukprot:XP_013905594.1 alpha-1,2-mannosyltransferase [Monoraphidium neglectum]